VEIGKLYHLEMNIFHFSGWEFRLSLAKGLLGIRYYVRHFTFKVITEPYKKYEILEQLFPFHR
jgi:hypothetical protein